MKKSFLAAVSISLCMFVACSDDSTGINASDSTDKDEGIIADTSSYESSTVDTDNGATFETKGSGYTDAFSDEIRIAGSTKDMATVLDSYESDDLAGVTFDYAYSGATTIVTEEMGGEYFPGEYAIAPGGKEGGKEGGFNGRTHGLLTASEWNDLDNWSSWAEILTGEFSTKTGYWKFYPNTLVAVQVVDENDVGLANVSVELLKEGETAFATKTDNTGKAYCWINLFDGDTGNAPKNEDFSLKVNGKVSAEPPKITAARDSLNINVVVSDARQAEPKADIAFIVDATGSMGDEIQFLKSDLSYIIDHAYSDTKVALRTAVVFYRDEDDEYIVRGKDFSTDVANTQAFIEQQQANGGGDYPEAVHSALEASLQNFSWNESARARIAFLILDAPAHHQDDIVESLQSSITLYAKNGIKLIPVAASGVDKDTESMLRFFDIVTGGTYVFLTDDSGIGYSHIEASVGDHDVEKLADLMIRLIKKYVD